MRTLENKILSMRNNFGSVYYKHKLTQILKDQRKFTNLLFALFFPFLCLLKEAFVIFPDDVLVVAVAIVESRLSSFDK